MPELPNELEHRRRVDSSRAATDCPDYPTNDNTQTHGRPGLSKPHRRSMCSARSAVDRERCKSCKLCCLSCREPSCECNEQHGRRINSSSRPTSILRAVSLSEASSMRGDRNCAVVSSLETKARLAQYLSEVQLLSDGPGSPGSFPIRKCTSAGHRAHALKENMASKTAIIWAARE